MSNRTIKLRKSNTIVEGGLPARITRAASKQTYYTIRFLVDRDHVMDAYRAYAYFRWLDDLVDCTSDSREEKIDLIDRQKSLLEACYHRHTPGSLTPEERMLADLVANDHEPDSGLQCYLRDMMELMAFDATRRGRILAQAELAGYTQLLSTAVTEALFYFIGHDTPPAYRKNRYMAVCGAHVVHMLRDFMSDAAYGYINIPAEYLSSHKLSIDDLDNESIHDWVYERVGLARRYLKIGKVYFDQVKNLRCRIAGIAYLARFEWTLKTIEQDGYYLRAAYPERKSFKAGLWMAWRIFKSMLRIFRVNQQSTVQSVVIEQIEE